MRQTTIILAIALIILLLAAGGFWIKGNILSNETDNVEDANGWRTYRNEQFGFELQYPADWEVAEFADNPAAPMFNFYKPGTIASGHSLPLTHHSDATHVSIFPQGIPTEGVFGIRSTSTVMVSASVDRADDFVLEDGTPWATFIRFRALPEHWNESGFLWAAVRINNLMVSCFRDGELISSDQCDPLTGDSIRQQGSINQADRAIEEQIIKTFKFIK